MNTSRWSQADLSKDRWVYIWVDGVYSSVRGDNERLCALVVIGVNERGQKRFLAIEDGIRESKQSWSEVLLGLKRRGLAAPRLAVGDGALGFWAAAEEVFGSMVAQRCWVHYAECRIMPSCALNSLFRAVSELMGSHNPGRQSD